MQYVPTQCMWMNWGGSIGSSRVLQNDDVAGICGNLAFPEMPRQFRKCLGNSRNAWCFFNCLGISGNA
jgi:hypothetical protein